MVKIMAKLAELESKIRSLDEFRSNTNRNGNAPFWIEAMLDDELIKLTEEHLALCQQRLDFYKSL